MDFELRVVVEKVTVSTQEVIQRHTVKVYDVTPPASILDLGLCHSEQISGYYKKVKKRTFGSQKPKNPQITRSIDHGFKDAKE